MLKNLLYSLFVLAFVSFSVAQGEGSEVLQNEMQKNNQEHNQRELVQESTQLEPPQERVEGESREVEDLGVVAQDTCTFSDSRYFKFQVLESEESDFALLKISEETEKNGFHVIRIDFERRELTAQVLDFPQAHGYISREIQNGFIASVECYPIIVR